MNYNFNHLVKEDCHLLVLQLKEVKYFHTLCMFRLAESGLLAPCYSPTALPHSRISLRTIVILSKMGCFRLPFCQCSGKRARGAAPAKAVSCFSILSIPITFRKKQTSKRMGNNFTSTGGFCR